MQTDTPSFATDIRPLFRDRDVNAMKRHFDLSNYSDVTSHSEPILARLKNGSMPCDGAWPVERVELFKRWIAGGKLP
jgi:hypothetical protein